MTREAWPSEPAWAILLAVCLTVPAGVGSLAEDPSTALEDEPSKEYEVGLAAPLMKLATTPSEVAQIQAAYAAGQGWGQARLADDAPVSGAVDDLYGVLDLEASSTTESVPEAFKAPLATLVTLQAQHAAGSGPFAGLTDDQAHAFSLGVLDPVIAAFEEARKDAPEKPVFVDPLGLIVLGGSGDNTYTPKLFATSWSKGPILGVEPAGDDEYRVPVAAPTSFNPVRDAPIDLGIQFQFATLALELGGNDTYTEQTASADFGGPASQAILVDRHGHDEYGTTSIERTTAHGSPGFAYLLDEEGNDEYYAAKEGIAHAYRGGTAVLWDQGGNDTYEAHPDQGRFTHAMAHSRQAKALLWDEEGVDAHQAHLYAYATAWNDAYARFLDERGNDTYHVEDLALSFGVHFEELVSLIGDNMVGRGLGEFIDGNGQDSYSWDRADDKVPTPYPGNETTRTIPWQQYGVFIDCETADDAHRPCEDEQHQARCTMLRHPYDAPSVADPVLPVVLDPLEDECRGLGP